MYNSILMINAEQFINKFVDWVKTQDEILAVALVGSYANGAEKSDSDIDLVIITNSPEIYLKDDSWIKNFGEVKEIKNEDFNFVKVKRVFYENGLEVEYGITTRQWAKTNPIDPGTKRVLNDGVKILYDKEGILRKLI